MVPIDKYDRAIWASFTVTGLNLLFAFVVVILDLLRQFWLARTFTTSELMTGVILADIVVWISVWYVIGNGLPRPHKTLSEHTDWLRSTALIAGYIGVILLVGMNEPHAATPPTLAENCRSDSEAGILNPNTTDAFHTYLSNQAFRHADLRADRGAYERDSVYTVSYDLDALTYRLIYNGTGEVIEHQQIPNRFLAQPNCTLQGDRN